MCKKKNWKIKKINLLILNFNIVLMFQLDSGRGDSGGDSDNSKQRKWKSRHLDFKDDLAWVKNGGHQTKHDLLTRKMAANLNKMASKKEDTDWIKNKKVTSRVFRDYYDRLLYSTSYLSTYYVFVSST